MNRRISVRIAERKGKILGNVCRHRYKEILPFLLLALLSLFFCWFFVGRYGIFGAKVDWISQHSVIPDYFRQQFYETGELFPEFAANIGGGQNIYNFSYYGLFSPVILVSYLFPFVKMGDYLMAASVISLAAAVLLFYGWLLKRGFSGKISFMVSLMYLLSGPMIFHSYSQIMFVNYMPFLCMAFLGVDSYFDQGKKLLYTVSVFLMIMTSFYFSIGGMLALVLYGIYRYLECGGRNRDSHRGRIKDRAVDDQTESWLYGGIEDGIRHDVKLRDQGIKIVACNIKAGGNDFSTSKINIACDLVFGFLWDGIRFLCPMVVSVLMSGILLVPTAAALAGREGGKGEIGLLSLLVPNIQVDCMLYTPYAIGLTTFLVTVLITGFTYQAAHERVLSWGCTVVLTIPFFTWALNGGLYIREKALIPFLPLLCYTIAYYIKKIEDERISFIVGAVPFLITIGILCVGQKLSGISKYGKLYLIDAVVMAGCYLLFYFREAASQVDMLACTFGDCRAVFDRKKQSMFLLTAPVVFLVLFGSVFHERAARMESREFYERVTDPDIGQVIQETLAENEGFYRLEQVGTEEENAADLNRVWNKGQYISSIYSSSYNKEYQNFRKEVFGVEEPFRNDMMQSVSRNPVFLKLMGVRYLISEEEIPGYEAVRDETAGYEAVKDETAGYEAVKDEAAGDETGRAAGRLSVHENHEAAPIAYVTDQMVSEKAYADLEFPYNQMILVCGAVREEKDGEDERAVKSETVEILGAAKTETRDAEAVETQILEEVRKAVVPVEVELPEQESGALRITREGNGYRVRADKKGKIQLEVPDSGTAGVADGERILFLQFDVKNRKSEQDVSVWLEGEKNKLSASDHIYYNGNTTFSFAVALEKGKNSVELALGKGDYELTHLECFLGDWGKQAQQERSSKLYQAEFYPNQEKTEGNVISGSVDVEREGDFVTSIPYDCGFEIRVDGKAVEYEKVNTAFLGFPVREGMHNVEMVYHAPGRKAGAWCSVVGAVILFSFLVVRKVN